jgi:hypothetical protein
MPLDGFAVLLLPDLGIPLGAPARRPIEFAHPTLIPRPFRREGWVYEEKVDGWRNGEE